MEGGGWLGGLDPYFGFHKLTREKGELMSCKSPPVLSLVRWCTLLILVNLGQKGEGVGGGGMMMKMRSSLLFWGREG